MHAMAVFEALARDVTNPPDAKIAHIVEKRPDLFSNPLDKSLGMLWGFASIEARHTSETRGVAEKEATHVSPRTAAHATTPLCPVCPPSGLDPPANRSFEVRDLNRGPSPVLARLTRRRMGPEQSVYCRVIEQ